MSMILTEEQEMLQKTAQELISERAPVAHLRALRDARDETGFSRELWKEMAELGWAGIALPEEFGGSGLGLADLGILLEECGRTLAPEPLMSTVVLGATAILLGGDEDQQRNILPGVCSGDTLLTLAFEESGRFAPYRVETRAEETVGGFSLTGSKTFALDGHIADLLIVSARSSGESGERDGLSLFLVDPRAKGVEVQRTLMVDSRNAARLTFQDVVVPRDALLGRLGYGADVLDPVLERATAALSAEMLGCACEAFERTVEYLKTREQFQAKIGSFQALKHRASHHVLRAGALPLHRPRRASRHRRGPRGAAATLVSTAKARVSDTAGLVTREAIQMHGGIGMTDEEEIGFFLKRARTAELFLGDAAYHRERFATLQGF